MIRDNIIVTQYVNTQWKNLDEVTSGNALDISIRNKHQACLQMTVYLSSSCKIDLNHFISTIVKKQSTILKYF